MIHTQNPNLYSSFYQGKRDFANVVLCMYLLNVKLHFPTTSYLFFGKERMGLGIVPHIWTGRITMFTRAM